LLLAERFAADSAKRLGREVPEFSEDVLSLLRQYSWPGNVRELRNIIEDI
jgi:DNA-binding NtrC family response regulator